MANDLSYQKSVSNTQVINEHVFSLPKTAYDNFGKYKIETDNHKLQLFSRKKFIYLIQGNYKTLNEILNEFSILNEQLISFLLVQKSLLQQHPDLHLYPCPEVRHKRCLIYTRNIYDLKSC